MFLAGVISHLRNGGGITRCVSTNRPSLWLFTRTRAQLGGLECQACVLLSGVAGRVEESLTDPGQLSTTPQPPALGRCGTLSLGRLFTWKRLTLADFMRGFSEKEAELHCCIVQAVLLLQKKKKKLQKAEAVRCQWRLFWEIYACCCHADDFFLLFCPFTKNKP